MPSPKILIVEDNPADVYILRLALQELAEEFDLEVASDGERALQHVRQERENPHDMHPCVILLDLHLPKYDGFEVLRAIRQEPVLSHIHVVVTTSIASPRDEAELRRLGADYRLKPRDLAEFTKLAADLIAICKGLRTSE